MFNLKNWPFLYTFCWLVYFILFIFVLFFNYWSNLPVTDYFLFFCWIVYLVYYMPPIFLYIKQHKEFYNFASNFMFLLSIVIILTFIIK